MKWVADFFIAAFGGIFSWLLSFAGKGVAVGAAYLATSLALLAAFYVAMKLAVAGLVYQISNQYMLMGFWVIWPPNAELCFSAYWTFHVVAFIYREKRDKLEAVTRAF